MSNQYSAACGLLALTRCPCGPTQVLGGVGPVRQRCELRVFERAVPPPRAEQRGIRGAGALQAGTGNRRKR
eukprot:15462266-Alexandrium_andersonii.AAC.1